MGGLVSKAIFPSPKTSYTETDFTGVDRLFKIKTQNYKKQDQEFDLPVLFIPYLDENDYTSPYILIYFHANAEDLGLAYDSILFDIRASLQVSIISIEYPSYGLYTQAKASAGQIEQDATRLYQFVVNEMHYPEQNIILFGRSIGGGPASILAARYKPRALIYFMCFSTLRKVAENVATKMGAKFVPDLFRNIDLIQHLTCPILILHGKKDELVPIQQAQEMYKEVLKLPKIPNVKHRAYFSDKMSHSSYFFEQDLLNPVKEFMQANKIDLFSNKSRQDFVKLDLFKLLFKDLHEEILKDQLFSSEILCSGDKKNDELKQNKVAVIETEDQIKSVEGSLSDGDLKQRNINQDFLSDNSSASNSENKNNNKNNNFNNNQYRYSDNNQEDYKQNDEIIQDQMQMSNLSGNNKNNIKNYSKIMTNSQLSPSNFRKSVNDNDKMINSQLSLQKSYSQQPKNYQNEVFISEKNMNIINNNGQKSMLRANIEKKSFNAKIEDTEIQEKNHLEWIKNNANKENSNQKTDEVFKELEKKININEFDEEIRNTQYFDEEDLQNIRQQQKDIKQKENKKDVQIDNIIMHQQIVENKEQKEYNSSDIFKSQIKQTKIVKV